MLIITLSTFYFKKRHNAFVGILFAESTIGGVNFLFSLIIFSVLNLTKFNICLNFRYLRR